MRKKAIISFVLAMSMATMAGCTATTLEQTGSSAPDTVTETTDSTTEAEQTDATTEVTQETTEEVTTEATEEATTSDEVSAISADEATSMLMAVLGEQDPDTGNAYMYEYIENVQIEGVTYLAFEWKMDDGEQSTAISDLFVTADGKNVYQGTYSGPDSSDVYLDKKMN